MHMSISLRCFLVLLSAALEQTKNSTPYLKTQASELMASLEDSISMENNRISKIVLDAKLDGKKKVDRPKLIWLDDVQANLRIKAIKGWRSKAQDR